jgi:hypothetical protein
VKRNGGVTNPIMVQMGRDKDISSVSLTLTDQPSVLSISMESIRNSDSTTVQDSHSGTVSFYTAKSLDEPGMEHQCQLAPPPGLLPTVRPVSVPSAPPPVFLPIIRPGSVPSAPLQAFLSAFRPVSVPSAPPPEIPPTARPASVLPHFPDASESTMPVQALASSSVETV